TTETMNYGLSPGAGPQLSGSDRRRHPADKPSENLYRRWAIPCAGERVYSSRQTRAKDGRNQNSRKPRCALFSKFVISSWLFSEVSARKCDKARTKKRQATKFCAGFFRFDRAGLLLAFDGLGQHNPDRSAGRWHRAEDRSHGGGADTRIIPDTEQRF